jgi:ABC-type dipeptide/oligopeptide/nickel transport system permease component
LKPSLARPMIFGLGDGMVSLLGAVFFLAGHPSLVLPTAVTSGATAAVSMAGFDWLSDDTDHGFGESCLLGLATWAGSVLPAFPWAFLAGSAAIACSVIICAATGVLIALLRPQRGKGLSVLETAAVFGTAFAAIAVCTTIFPGGGG